MIITWTLNFLETISIIIISVFLLRLLIKFIAYLILWFYFKY